MRLSRFVVITLVAAWTLFSAGMVDAQGYPSKPVRIITAAAGTGSDFVARLIAQGISNPLGQPVVVDNRGTGNLAADAVFNAPPDGYTLYLGGAALWLTPLLQKTVYDVEKDFAPISLLSREVLVLTVHPSLPATSVKELIALAKSKPGALNYGAGTVGGANHLATELFASMAGINIVRISYKGAVAEIAAAIGGEIQLMILDAGLVMPQVQAGKLRALAVTSATPSSLAPGLTTVSAAGLPGYEWIGMTHIMAPAKTPAPIIVRLNQEVVRSMNQSETKERLLNVGEELVANSPEQFAATIKSEIAKMSKVIKEAGIKVE